jgi:hypothetical protein
MSIVQLRSGDTTYTLNLLGEVTYTSPRFTYNTPSGSWKVVGAVEYGRGFTGGTVIRSYTLEDILANQVPWFYKNAIQRCFVKDYDHGSYRVWMSPALRSVWIAGVGYVKGCHMNPFKRGEGR